MARAKQLITAQIGAESTWGTAVAQTASLSVNDITLTPEVQHELLPAGGNLASATDAAIVKVGGSASLEERANYGTVGLWLQGAFGAATDAGGGPYTHTWQFAGTTSPTRKFYTLAAGDATDSYSLNGALVTELKLTFTPGQMPTAAVSFAGMRVTTDTLDSVSAFTDITQLMLPSEVTIALDTIGGTLGATSLACDAISAVWTLTVETPLQYGLGTNGACDYATTKVEHKLELSAEFGNSAINTAIEALLGATPSTVKRDVQIKIYKSANYSLIINAPMVLAESPEYWQDADGMLTVDTVWTGIVDASSTTTSNYLDVVLTNQDAVV